MADENTPSCVVCCQHITNTNKKAIYAIGKCDHSVCYECSTRIRVLCKQNECPICRQQLEEVVFTRNRQKKFEEWDLKKCLYRNDYGIYFEDEDSLESYGRLLEHPCRKCRNKTFKTIHDLTTHLRKEHELFMCDLCVENLKLFSHERTYYTRKELVRHRKTGDPDERSHRGHPICTFCDQRYVDDDDLHLHLRREHFYCHFCDPSGFSQFYGDYAELKNHFINAHFLCKECDTLEEKFTNAFKTEIDLQAHIAQFHSQNMSKSDLKKAKTLQLDSFIRQRAGQILDNGQQSKRQIKREQRRHNNHNHNQSDDSDSAAEDTAAAAPVMPPRPEDFPSLVAGAGAGAAQAAKQPGDNKNSVKPNKKPSSYSVYLSKNPKLNTTNDDEFPALPGGSSGGVMSGSAITYNRLAKQKPSIAHKTQTDVRKNVNLIDSSIISNQQTKQKSNKPLVMNKEEFPSLPVTKKKNKPVTATASSISYGHNSSSAIKSKENQNSEWNASQNETKNSGNNIKSLNNIMASIEDFPTLEPKKTTSKMSSSKPKLEFKSLSRPLTANPPPGLPSVKKKTSDLSLSLVAKQVISNGSDDSNSNEFTYINPIDFNERNQALVKLVESVLSVGSDRSKFLLFKEASKQFRQSLITGDQYYNKCLEIFDRKHFSPIFTELLVLLPDISKQNELLRAQQTDLKSTRGAIPKGFRLLNDHNSNELVVCDKCRQVMVAKDQSHHQNNHRSGH